MREDVRVSEHAWFAAWIVIGCALALGVVSFAVGPLVFLPAALIAVLMFRSHRARRSADGALIGIGLLLLFVAYVNRAGTEPASSDLNPLPWLGLGLTFVVGGLLTYRLRRN
jgi:uncharacterized membrane protein YidH (DUF202 family)